MKRTRRWAPVFVIIWSVAFVKKGLYGTFWRWLAQVLNPGRLQPNEGQLRGGSLR